MSAKLSNLKHFAAAGKAGQIDSIGVNCVMYGRYLWPEDDEKNSSGIDRPVIISGGCYLAQFAI